MVAGRINGCAAAEASGRAAGYTQAIGKLLDLRAYRAQSGGERSDAIAFLDAQLTGVADFNSLLRVRRERGEHGQFINHGRDGGAGNCSAAQGSVTHGEIADQFAVAHGDGDDANRGVDRNEKIEDCGARGIEADAFEDEIGAREDERGGKKKYSRGKISGNCQGTRMEMRAAFHLNKLFCATDAGAEFEEGDFGVIARGYRLGDGSAAIGKESGEKNGGLDLRARQGRGVINGAKRSAANGERREFAFAGGNVRAHKREGLDDAAHGTAAQGRIASKCRGKLLTCEDARKKAHGGAGIFGVERAARSRKTIQAFSQNVHAVFGALDFDAEAREAF